jgi:hypothetical protein
MTTRIYAVQGPDTFRLIEAGTKAAALRHVARDIIRVEVANQKTLVAAMQDGVKVEKVSLESETAE